MDNTNTRQQQHARLTKLEAAFDQAGGRGVELADEIDTLRVELGYTPRVTAALVQEGQNDAEDSKDSNGEEAIKAKYRAAARRIHHQGGELEIDDNAVVSLGSDPGAYVAAWVWVPNHEAGISGEGDES